MSEEFKGEEGGHLQPSSRETWPSSQPRHGFPAGRRVAMGDGTGGSGGWARGRGRREGKEHTDLGDLNNTQSRSWKNDKGEIKEKQIERCLTKGRRCQGKLVPSFRQGTASGRAVGPAGTAVTPSARLGVAGGESRAGGGGSAQGTGTPRGPQRLESTKFKTLYIRTTREFLL